MVFMEQEQLVLGQGLFSLEYLTNMKMDNLVDLECKGKFCAYPNFLNLLPKSKQRVNIRN